MKSVLVAYFILLISCVSFGQSNTGYFSNKNYRAEIVVTDVSEEKLDSLHEIFVSTSDSLDTFFYLCGKAKILRFKKIDSAFSLIAQARTYISDDNVNELSPYLYYVQGLLFIELNSFQDAYLLFYKVYNSPFSTTYLRFESLRQLFVNNIQLQGLENQLDRSELITKQEELFNEFIDENDPYYAHFRYKLQTSKAILATLMGEDEEALRYFKEALAQAILINSDPQYYNALGNVGYGYAQLGQYDSAIIFLKQDYWYSLKHNRVLSLTGILSSLVDTYSAIGQLDSAYYYLMKNDSVIKGSEKYAWVKKHYQQLINYYEQVGDAKNVIAAKDNYIAIVDTINQVNEANFMRYAESKSILEKTESELKNLSEINALNEEMLKANMKFTAIFAVLATLVIVSFIFLYKNMQEKKAINKRLVEQKEEIETQKDKLFNQHDHIQKQYETIREMNVVLEKEAEIKGETIDVQNQKITNYEHFNSHRLRAPIARLLGLAYLLKNDYLNDENEHKDFIDKIDHCVQELDEEVKKFSRELER